MDDNIEIQFSDGLLIGRGSCEVDRAALYSEAGGVVVQKSDVVYLNLKEASIYSRVCHRISLQDGEYVVMRGGLFKKVELAIT